jgi:hypothetical protein
MIVISGMKCLESLEKQNQDGLLEKMLKALLISTKAWYSDRCLMTWKTKVSKANVLLFQLQASVRGINENESGLWLTPTATDMSVRSEEAMEKRKEYRSKIGRKTVPPGSLSEQVMYGKPIVNMYPTPRAADVEGGAVKNVQLENGHFFRENKKGVRWGVKLRDAVEMYPTPTRGMYKQDVKDNGEYARSIKEKGHQIMLPAFMKLYPTPTTRDHKDSTLSPAYKNRNSDSLPVKMMKEGKPGGRLNPNFVEFLMGYPMNWTKIDPTE